MRGLAVRAAVMSAALTGSIGGGAPAVAADGAGQPAIPGLRVTSAPGSGAAVWSLSVGGGGAFHSTAREVVDERVIAAPGGGPFLILWSEREGASTVPMYAVSHDGAGIAGRVREATYLVRLRYDTFDPAARQPAVAPLLAAAEETDLHLVQFVVPPLREFREEITALGGTVLNFCADHTHTVRMTPAVRAQVAALPYVRWVGPVHTAYKLEEPLVAMLAAHGGAQSAVSGEPARYSIELYERGAAAQERVAGLIGALGGRVEARIEEGFRLEAVLTPAQLLEVARSSDVYFIDRWGPPGQDMVIARGTAGSNATWVETNVGFTGQGVRGEVMDGGLRTTHIAFQDPPPLLHSAVEIDNHGTRAYGVVFGNGAGNGAGRGMLPGRQQGIVASYFSLIQNGGSKSRYQHTSELTDPNGPYRAVFQSNSWGSARTQSYNTVSAEMDDILFLNDIVILNSMSNEGNTMVRPEAWAKNVVGVGGLYHYNNTLRADDKWDFGASIGPAFDGRVKPDFTHFYDSVFCTNGSSDTAYTNFGGTSAATPIVAGAFGILFQMWHEGVFDGFGLQDSVFDSRPKATTARALLVNTAYRYPFASPGDDLARNKQGWGMPDLRALYESRVRMLIIDESDPLAPFEVRGYTVAVEPGEPVLRVTMVYLDPKGPTNAKLHRINDLSLRVTAPDGTYYWGNNGLWDGNWSTPGGDSNTIDTVENVFVQDPAPGLWTVEVFADEIVQDARPETPELDADFALVVAGAVQAVCYADFNADGALNIFDFLAFVNAFNAADPAADCDGNGALNLFDFLCYVSAFNDGC